MSAQIHTYTHVHTNMHTYTHARTHALTHARTHRNPLTCPATGGGFCLRDAAKFTTWLVSQLSRSGASLWTYTVSRDGAQTHNRGWWGVTLWVFGECGFTARNGCLVDVVTPWPHGGCGYIYNKHIVGVAIQWPYAWWVWLYSDHMHAGCVYTENI